MPRFHPYRFNQGESERAEVPYAKEKVEVEVVDVDARTVEWHYGERNDSALRKYAFEKATHQHYGDSSRRIDDVIEDAIKIEAYLRGELNDL
jgi:hypothetical protein